MMTQFAFQPVHNLVRNPRINDPKARVTEAQITVNREAYNLLGNGHEEYVDILVDEGGSVFMVKPGREFKLSHVSAGTKSIYSKDATRQLLPGRYYLYETRGPAIVFMWHQD